MRLQPSPFEKIKNGSKTIEIRLNDEKRQLIKAGDQIEFALMTDPEQKTKTEVEWLEKFESFKDLFAAYPPNQYGGESQDEWESMYKHYSPEDEKKFGVLALKVKVI